MDQSTATPPMAPVDAGTDKSRAFARIDRLVESYGRANTRFGENPFAAAVEAALGAYGISAAQSPEQIARLRQADSLSAACGLANARTRAVTLRPDWFRSDHGHMVGVLTEPEGADVPVALIRETVGRYRLVRGDTGAAQRVTQAVAEQVAVEALEIFPGFQPGMATIGGLARAILPSIRTELRWTAFIGALISLLAAGLPVATAFVIDVIIPGDERRLLIEIGVGLAIAALIMATLEVIRGRLLLRVDGVTSVVLQTAVWDHVLQLPAAVHRRYPSGDLQNRVDAVDTVRSTIISTVLTATLTAAFSVFYLALLFFYDARLAWFAVLFVLTLTLASIAISLYLRRFYRQQAELSGWLGGYVFQMLQAVVKLRGARAEGRALSRWADAYADWLAL
ncbi:MAG: ABC transporter transmembrane domain-containing protein, partial [Pseudomonadota bacterium]